jgi:pyochelin synthetase
MMQSLLGTLAELNVKLEVRDGELHVNAPAGALTAELRRAIGQQKNTLIEMLQSASDLSFPEQLPQIVPDPGKRYQSFPLNEVQHAYWIGRSAQIELGLVSTHMYYELECTALDSARLASSFRAVLQRHDMLRAVIDANGQQRVLESVPAYEIKVSDLAAASPEQRECELLRLRSEMSHQVFPCDQWPLFEIRLMQISAEHSRLCVSWDFLMVDAWSLMLIFQQWFGFYRDPAYQVAAPELSFRDYVLAEASLKRQPAYKLSRKYWWDRLEQLPPAPQLAVSSHIERGRKPEFSRRKLKLAADQWNVIKTRAARSGITPTSVLLAAFAEVLNLWSRVPHYCLNLTLFNRLPLHQAVNSVVGDFTNLLALEIDARERCTFVELCTRIQAQFLADYEHRQVNALEVLRELAKRRGGQQVTLPVVFSSTLMLDRKRSDDAGVLEKFGPMGYGISQTPQVSLDYQIFEVNGDLVINWDGVEEVFPPGMLDDMFASHQELLYMLARDADAWGRQDLAALPQVQQQTREQVDNTTAAVFETCLHQLFIEKALECPENIALVHSSGVIRYGALLAHSCLVAEELVGKGVRPQELVAVVMQKGWEQVVAVLGILIAGAAYLPVEPHWPTLRRNHILEQGDVRIVLTQPALRGELAWPPEVQTIDVRPQDILSSLEPVPAIRQSADDLAYVIFTSGSTGTPKGVMISHRGAVNTIIHLNRMFNVGANDRVLAVSDLTFDLSVYDIFGLLAAGGTIVIPDASLSRDVNHWETLVRRHEVTLWNSAPPLMGMIVDGWQPGSQSHLPSLRLALLSGDWIPVSLPERIRRLSPGVQIISLGGATEGSIWSIYYPIDEVASDWDSVPYGRALPNQHMYVRNQALRPCPDMSIGEIYIGGLGVALGYWKDPEKTARQFLTDPRSGERLYYTGDLGRMRTDGNIEFLGRADNQVKLRGHRVELGEIAACLQSHPAIRAAAVRVLKQDNRLLLTAYVVPQPAGSQRAPEQTELSPEGLPNAYAGIEAAAKECLLQADRSGLQMFWDFWQAAEGASIRAMLETLQSLDLLIETETGADASGRLDHLVAAGRVLPQFRRLLVRWLAALESWGHLRQRGGNYALSAGNLSGEASAEAQLRTLEESFGHDERLQGFVEHLARCLRNHPSLLRGDLSPLTLLFPGGSWRVAESLYQRNPVVQHHNRLLASIVASLLEQRKGDKTLQVLEIGAGTGATSQAVLPVLPAGRTEYTFTDVSAYFFSAATEKFKAYPFVRYAVFDLLKTPGEQGYLPQSYDLIIGANVLHNARDLGATLTGIRELLKPGGYLLLLEGTQTTPWLYATVAFLEADRVVNDSRSNADRWILGVEDWMRALAAAGFEGLQSFPEPAHPEAADERLAQYLKAMPQHVIVAQASNFRTEDLGAFVRDRLPDYMVPQRFVLLDKLPLTSNGKIDLAGLPADLAIPENKTRQVASPTSESEQQILNIWRSVLRVEHLSVTDNFFEVGGDSLLITEVMRQLNRLRSSEITIADFFAYPTIRSLADYLTPRSNPPQVRPVTNSTLERTTEDIAIIGMAGRFPDADNVEQFWHNVAAGKCAVRNFSNDELLGAGISAEELADPDYVRAGLVLKNMDLFDASFFGFTPRDAEILDPQQRFLLESAVEALELAGYPSEERAGRVGVFVGKGTSLYMLEHLLPNAALLQQFGMMPILNANEKDYAATLISYKLNLTGPSVNVNTACSTSLVAVHLACESLLNHECEVALAGGVSFVNLQASGYMYQEGHILSRDGVCRAFSDDADGTVFGSGVGLVALKPLSAALRDRDTIYAVIKGTAINNDGALKVSYSAPSLHGQADVIAKAQARAGTSPESIQLIEAHGTGTELGDPIEFSALRKVFGGPRPDGTRCALGSVKTAIGHLDSAAGVTGLIKVVQALRHKQIPPTLHVSVPTRRVAFQDSPFDLPPVLREWPSSSLPRRAGVSSFGVGGTNAHIVLEETPAGEEQTGTSRPQLLPLSAKDPASLERMKLALAEALGTRLHLSLEDVAFTLQVGRNAYSHRSYAVSDGMPEAQAQFANPERLPIVGFSEEATPAVVFLFPGQGSLEMDASYELYEQEPGFRSAFDECADLLQQYTSEDARAWLYTKRQPSARTGSRTLQIEQTAVTQPLLFSLEYALARYWELLGVRPAAMLGHSLGEYVAACLAGVFSLPEALSLMVVRGRLLQSLPPGSMLAVNCSEAQVRPLLESSSCSLAAVNGPLQCVVSGPIDAIDALRNRLTAAQLTSTRLRTSHAFHSQMMEPVLETFENCVAAVERHAPAIPFISNVTGRWISDEEATSPAYWSRHLLHTVRFGDGVQQVLALQNRVLLEVGPGRILTTLVKQSDRSVPAISSFNKGPGPHAEWRSFLDAVGQLWQNGVAISWAPLHQGRRPGRVPLPGYAFDRKRYWIERRVRLGRALALVDEPAPHAVPGLPEEEPMVAREGCGTRTEGIGLSGPQSAIAERLVEIFKSYLGITDIGARDSFFELGGDSLLAARLHAQIRQEFSVGLPLVRMFELNTIQRVSLYIAISRDPTLIDTLSDEDLDEVLAVMESWPAQTHSEIASFATTNEGEGHHR